MQAVDFGEVAFARQANRDLGEVVAQDELRIDTVHALGTLGVDAVFVAQARRIAQRPGVERGPIDEQVALRHVGRAVAAVKTGQAPKRDREIAAVLRHQGHHVIDQRIVRLFHHRQAQLGRHARHHRLRKHALVGFERGHSHVGVTDQRQQRLRERMQVPQRHAGLACKRITPLVVAVIADVAGVERVEETVRAIVDRQAQHRHVVGVHHAVAEADRLPLGHQRRRAARHGFEQGRIRLLFCATSRVMVLDHEVGEPPQRRRLIVVRKMFEVAESNEAGCHACHDGGGFDFLAPHRQRRAGHAQGARGGNAQAVHRFGTKEFANRGAQHGAPVAHAGIGGQSRALELQLQRAGNRVDLTQPQRPAITQLPGPHAELVAAVDAGQRLHAVPQRVAAEHLERAPVGPLGPVMGQPEQFGAVETCGHPDGGGHRHGRELGVKLLAQRLKAVRPCQAECPHLSGQGVQRGSKCSGGHRRRV